MPKGELTLKVYTFGRHQAIGDLMDLADEDDNGNNGDEFLLEEASGHTCNFYYYLKQCVSQLLSSPEIRHVDISKLISLLYKSGYYKDVTFEITLVGNTCIISIATIT